MSDLLRRAALPAWCLGCVLVLFLWLIAAPGMDQTLIEVLGR